MPVRRVSLIVVVLAAATLLGAGCFLPQPWPPVSTTTTTTTTAPPETTTTTTTAPPETTTTTTTAPPETTTTTTTAPPETTTTTTTEPQQAALCGAGSFNSTTGREPCAPAPPGFFVDQPGALQASPCSVGTYQPVAGQSSCLQAPIGSYVDSIAATAAITCPALTTTAAAGSTSAGDCVGLVPASLVFSNAADGIVGNFGYLSGAGLQPGAWIIVCADQFSCRPTGLRVEADGTLAVRDALFPALPCKTNIYFYSTTAAGQQITSNVASYPPGTPGCP